LIDATETIRETARKTSLKNWERASILRVPENIAASVPKLCTVRTSAARIPRVAR
jgi:hypothetical protein